MRSESRLNSKRILIDLLSYKDVKRIIYNTIRYLYIIQFIIYIIQLLYQFIYYSVHYILFYVIYLNVTWIWLHTTWRCEIIDVINLLGLLLRFAGELEASQVWKRSDVTLLRLLRLRKSSCCTLGALGVLGVIVCNIHVSCNFCRSWRLAFSRSHVSAKAGCASKYLYHKDLAITHIKICHKFDEFLLIIFFNN